MSIRWITEQLGTAAYDQVQCNQDIHIVDVRELVDKIGNNPDIIQEKVQEGITLLKAGKRIVICCDYGMSRSNSIAAGILSVYKKIDFDSAIRIIQQRTGETEIKIQMLDAVRNALNVFGDIYLGNMDQVVFITGGSGFVGKHVQRALNANYTVIAPTHSEINLLEGTTALDLLLRKYNVRNFIHLANPHVYTTNNAVGQTLTILKNVIDVCVSQDINLIYPSTSEVYHGYSGMLLVNEFTPLFPRGPYGEAKCLAEELINYSRATSGLKCTVVRSTLMYGERSLRPRFIFNFIDRTIESRKIVTHRYLNGDPYLDLLHISDFVSAIKSIVNMNYIGTLNLGTSVLTSTKKIAEIINSTLGKTIKIENIDIHSNFASIAMEYTKAKNDLGWNPNVNLETGLKELINIYLNERREDG